jgi:MarR family transcriptional regulator for hemolysin
MKTFTYAIFIHVLKEYSKHFEALCEEYDLTQTEVDVLAFLANNPEYKYARDIVKIRRLTKPQASKAIDVLVKKGYISQETDPDNRRLHILMLNQEADALIQKIQNLQQEFEKKMYSNLSEEEKEQFLQLLKSVDQAFE